MSGGRPRRTRQMRLRGRSEIKNQTKGCQGIFIGREVLNAFGGKNQ